MRTADTESRFLGFFFKKKVLRADEHKSNYSAFNLLGFDKHLLMQVSATKFFISVFSTRRNVIALHHTACIIHTSCLPYLHAALRTKHTQKQSGYRAPPSPLLRRHGPKKPVSLLHSPLNYSICKAQITKYIFASKSFTYLQKNRTA